MSNDKKDIEGRDQVEILVNTFYDKVKTDSLLAPIFSHVDWPAHLPVMYNFWSSILLGDQTYQGNTMQKHFPLAIERKHFERWLLHFNKTVDENFAGSKAEEAKQRAESIAMIFQFKMNLLEKDSN